MKNPEYMLIGLLAGVAAELLQLPIYKNRISAKKYEKLFKAPLYWVCTLGLIIGGAIVAWALNADQDNQKISTIFLTGLGARSIIRELLTAKNATSATTLGDDGVSSKDLFS